MIILKRFWLKMGKAREVNLEMTYPADISRGRKGGFLGSAAGLSLST
jgi:hypothetical protein